jgi:hypothetical protein
MSDDLFDIRLKWVKNAVDSLFDNVIGSHAVRDEDGWERLLHLVNETGRLVLRLPSHESSESDIFGALDDIAFQLEGTKSAITQTATEARVVMGELHKALEPLLPEEGEEPETDPEAPATNPPVPQGKREEPPKPEEVPSRVGRVSEEPVRVSIAARQPVEGYTVECEGCHQHFKKGPGIAAHRRACPVLHPAPQLVTRKTIEAAESVPGGPQTPNEEDERAFAVIRRLGRDAAYGAVGSEIGIGGDRLYQRLALLAKYDTLPVDIAAWRTYRSTRRGQGVLPPKDRVAAALDSEEERVRAVAADIKAREAEIRNRNVAEMDDFMAKRRAEAAKRADVSWAQRTGENPA